MHRDATPLFVAVAASVSIHIAVIPLVSNQQFSPLFAPPVDASHLETPRLEKDEITLGIESSEATTLTWIGYDQYQKHLARLAEVEQAEMQLESLLSNIQPIEIDPETSNKTVQSVLDDLSRTTAPITDIAMKLLDALRNLQFSTASDTQLEPKEPTPNQQQNARQESQPVDESSDLEADAMSIVEVPRASWKSGRPIAAEGIILRPRRPSFTAHQTVTNAPRGLTAVLVIDHRGRPVDVEVITGTGSSSIDRSLVASLYRWRAAGEKIDALTLDNTFRITIHISFAR